jgi:SAM-dependent methyltransferase
MEAARCMVSTLMKTQKASREHTSAATDIDSPERTAAHAAAIRTKPFLKKIYRENYEFFKRLVDGIPEGIILELGSGGGFLKDVIPAAITSDVIKINNVDLFLSAEKLPFPDQSVGAILMIDVFHHLQNPSLFLDEARRCLSVGGKIVLIEPANTLWGRFIYQNFHHEPFIPEQADWQLPAGGPMSMANGALPWIVFCRDRALFEKRYPNLAIANVEPICPLRYLASGGVSRGQLAPSFTYPLFQFAEFMMSPVMTLVGMFMRIEIRKVRSEF